MKAPLILVLFLLTGFVGLPAQSQMPPATNALVNPSFDESGNAVSGWSQQGEQFGSARVVPNPVASAPNAVELISRGNRSGDSDSFMLFQVLTPTEFKGKKVEFGAKVRTDGGASNITLYTPEKYGNDYFTNVNSGAFMERRATLDVPANASFMSFGIQVFGKAGTKIYVDDAYVRIAGSATSASRGATPATHPAASVSSIVTTATIDASKRLGSTNPRVFGMHLEWSDSGNGLVNRSGSGLDQEVVATLKALRLPLFRFPGGILADYYDWTMAISPSGGRREMMNVFTNKGESAQFGSLEFVQLLKELGAEALLTANYGTGTAESAAAWARYFKDAGVKTPFWEIGNEIYLADPSKDQPNGKRIAKTGEQYAADFPRFRGAIRAIDPTAQIGAIAHVDTGAYPLAPGARRDWSARMVSSLSVAPDFVSVHNAYAPVIIDDSLRFDTAQARARVYRALYGAPQQTVEDLDEMQRLLNQSERTRNRPIAITEWGPRFGYSNRPEVNTVYVDQSRTMAAAVYVASLLDAIVADPRVLLATYTNPIHRWYGSLLTDTDRGLIKTPTYHVFSMYRTRFESRALSTVVKTATFDADSIGLVNARRDIPDVIVRSSISEDGRRLTAMLVNRNLDRSASARVTIDGFAAGRADCLVLRAPAPNAVNGPSLTNTTVSGEAIAPAPLVCEVRDGISMTIPPSGIVSMVVERRGTS